MSPEKKRRIRGILGASGIIVVCMAVVALLVLVSPTKTTRAASTLAFQATFDTSADFYGRFDFGVSGQSQAAPGVNGVVDYHGDHNEACGDPTTLRNIHVSGDNANYDASEMFWYCAPGGDPTKGHIMTGLLTLGYQHAWFAPKPMFTQISKVCWDINETALSSRKWTEVQFIDSTDATGYPVGSPTGADGTGVARGSGGFDLGYTMPGFNTSNDPNNGLFSYHDPSGANDHIAGLKDLRGTENWANGNGNGFVAGPGGDVFFGWPGFDYGRTIVDKASRYQHCITDDPANNQVVVDMDTPFGHRVVTIPGARIPQDARKVVFHDANYDPPKADDYQGDAFNTWHWDNIQVFTGTGPPPTTTTTTEPTTTTTEDTTTTTEPTTTTTEPTTTTTAPPTDSQIEWRDNGILGVDFQSYGYYNDKLLFKIRERYVLNRYPDRPWLLTIYLGYPTQRIFLTTLDEAKATAEAQLAELLAVLN